MLNIWTLVKECYFNYNLIHKRDIFMELFVDNNLIAVLKLITNNMEIS